MTGKERTAGQAHPPLVIARLDPAIQGSEHPSYGPMLTIAEIRRSLDGALRLLRGDPDGLRLLDLSLGGFWRSFLAIILVAPIYLLIALAEWRITLGGASPPASLDETRFALAKTVGLGLDWLAFPVLIGLLARPLGFAGRFVPYIVAYNWSAVIAAALLAPPTLLFAGGVLGGGVALLITLVLLGIVIRYRFLVARLALGVDTVTAIGLVALDLLLSLVLGELISRLAGT
jgi:hypothetical protein